MLGKAKIGLNCMLWFKDGCSERVFNIMLNGAVCLTDTSKYLLERFEHGNELVFYDLEDMEEMKQNVRGCLIIPMQQARLHRKVMKLP